MKKVLALLFLSFLFLYSPISKTGAYDFKNDSGISDVAPKIGYDSDSNRDPEYYVGTILSVVFSFMGLIFLILIIYSGIVWMTAQGNTSQIDKAKNTIVKAIVGLVICLSAYAITYFVMNAFQNTARQVENTSN